MKRALCAVALLALSACNFDAALDSYCEQSGRCSTANGGTVCALPRQQCSTTLPCCDGSSCSGGVCVVVRGQFALSLSPDTLSFGQVALGTTVERLVELRNDGEGPANAVTVVAYPSGGSFSVDASACTEAPLAPKASCPVRVRYTPLQSGMHAAKVMVGSAEAGGVHEALAMTGRSGASVVAGVAATGGGTVRSEPEGIACPGTCSAYFPLGQTLRLRATPAAGMRFVQWLGECTGADPTCELSVSEQTGRSVAEFEPLLTVEVVSVQPSAGSVRVQAGGYTGTCGDLCRMPAGGTVKLEAYAAPSHAFSGWEGACSGKGPLCELQVTAPTSVRARFTPLNVAFVTSAVYAPYSFGRDGSGADRACALEAAQRGLPLNTYRAWISSSTRSAREALGGARGWVWTDGRTLVADSPESLVDAGALRVPFLVGTYGWAQDPHVATGAALDGRLAPDGAATCSDWSEPTGTFHPGNARATTGSWLREEAVKALPCSTQVRLYCFGTDFAVSLPPPEPGTGPRAFLSSPWLPAGGVMAADAHCAADAAAVGLGGTFVAWLAPSGTTVGTYRGSAAWWNYSRIDGEFSTLEVNQYFPAPLNVTADGQYVGSSGQASSSALVWTGGGGTTDADTCNGWSGGGTGRVGRPEVDTESVRATVPGSDDAGRVPCDVSRRLYCFELR